VFGIHFHLKCVVRGFVLRRFLLLLVCAVGLSATTIDAQSSVVAPIRVSAGTILGFQVQTRLKADAEDSLDALPKGTVLRVNMLDSIDSAVNRDGAAFHGVVVSSVLFGDRVVIHSDAEVRGLLALFRTASHPEGFRYELVITGLVDHGEAHILTAYLDAAFSGERGKSPANSTAATNQPVVAKQPPQTGASEVAPN
jgi:hypothetical protein